MKGRGFAGRILEVDLSRAEINKRFLDEDLVRTTVGGFGTNASLALEYIPPRIDPLSPENVIIFGSGALSGTMAPGSARLAMTTKLPWNLMRMLNVREGFDSSQDTYPLKWLDPLRRANGKEASLYNKYDGKILDHADLEQMIEDYYDERSWDKKTGIPGKAKLRELGLQNVMEDGII